MDGELRGHIKARLEELKRIRAETHEMAQDYVIQANKRIAMLDAAIAELESLSEKVPPR